MAGLKMFEYTPHVRSYCFYAPGISITFFFSSLLRALLPPT